MLANYETIASAGMDLRANISEPITLKSLERTIVKTGLFLELPIGYEAQVRPKRTSCKKWNYSAQFSGNY
jgi:dUTP pyrophosphatase